MENLEQKQIVVVGGGSGIGRAIAVAAANQKASVTISSRNISKLNNVAAEIPGTAVIPVDMTDKAAIKEWASALPPIEHLLISASSAAHGPFETLAEGDLRSMFDAKFFGPYLTARAALPKIRNGGSITFFSGVLSRRPGLNCSGLGAVNGAVEGLARALALELGPRIRVNCVSPGMVRSDAYARLDEEKREAMYEATGASLPMRRVGSVEEAADAALFLINNSWTTGVVLDVDGGHMIRQYAQA